MHQENTQFDREKFKEAIWFLTSYCPPDELGNVKLHKMLYFSDMLHFLQEGKPLTGVEYLKQQFGPTARHLTTAIDELSRSHVIDIKTVDYHGFFKKEYRPLVEFRAERLSEDEISILRDVADFVRGKTAKEISEISHNAAWDAAAMGEVIPYFTALRLVPTEINESDRTWAREIARTHARERPL